MFALIFSFLLPSVLTCNEERKTSVNLAVAISAPDLELMKPLFDELFKENEFGYTLFGSKPVSFCFPIHDYNDIFRAKSINENFFGKIARCFRGALNAWEKNKHLFLNDKFSLVSQIYESDNYVFIVINKKEFVKVFIENQDLFISCFGSQISPELFLKKFELGEIELIHKTNHLLLGILLGYGRHNAILFQRRMEIEMKLECMLCLFPADTTPTSSEFSSMYAELSALKKTFSTFHYSDERLYPIQLPINFALDRNNADSKMLKKKYEVERNYISNIYSKKDWYEQTLIKLGE